MKKLIWYWLLYSWVVFLIFDFHKFKFFSKILSNLEKGINTNFDDNKL